jgi:hypothetical protein
VSSAIALLLAAVLLVVGSPLPSGTPEGSPGASPAPSVVLVDPNATAQDPLVWLPVKIDAGPDARFDAVMAWRHGFLIAGSDRGALAVWRSTDGRSWHESRIASRAARWPQLGLEFQTHVGLGVAGRRAVLVSTIWRDGRDRLAIWTSSTGDGWHRVADTPSLDIGPMRRLDDVVSAAGLVVVSVAALRGDVGAITTETSDLWRSRDGRRWTRVDGDRGLRRAPAAITPGDGRLLSVRPGPPDTAGTWMGITSRRGGVWRHLGLLPGYSTHALVGGALGFIAVGDTDEDQIWHGVWYSADGSTWTTALDRSDRALSDGANPATRFISDVAVDGPDAVAVGGWYTAESTITYRPWAATSADGGASWVVAGPQPGLLSGSMYRVAVSNGRAVAIGRTPEDRPAAWGMRMP